VHFDASYDSGIARRLLTTLGCDWIVNTNGTPLQAGASWVVERTNFWHSQDFRKLAIYTERRIRVIDAFIALASAIIIVRNCPVKPGPAIAGTTDPPCNHDLRARTLRRLSRVGGSCCRGHEFAFFK
jgi:hypothetical protein